MSGIERDRFEFRVRFGDTDCTGMIYFSVYVKWIDDSVCDYLRSRGLTYSSNGGLLLYERPFKETFVIGEYHCRIDRPSKI